MVEKWGVISFYYISIVSSIMLFLFFFLQISQMLHNKCIVWKKAFIFLFCKEKKKLCSTLSYIIHKKVEIKKNMYYHKIVSKVSTCSKTPNVYQTCRMNFGFFIHQQGSFYMTLISFLLIFCIFFLFGLKNYIIYT